ncbi:MAG TPA: FMN-binding negative transcriptional regulator [Pseudolysinimonas sp.]|nr:FMN-binding negative transcriptional regulator [Pseudolysinimonas sp.]
MRHTPHYILDDEAEIKRLVRENPWVTYVSQPDGMVASHYPTLLDETAEGIVLLTHFGRPDEQLHGVGGGREMLVIVQGAHGYISPSWYADEQDMVPTWNHVTAHLYGVPEVLTEEENLVVLERLVDHFEAGMPGARSLRIDPEKARRIAKGTVGIRVPVTRVEARKKLSQARTDADRESVTAQLGGDGRYSHHGLAEEMRRIEGLHPAENRE